MKKSARIFSLTLIGIVMLCFSGCNGSNDTPTTTAYFFIAEELRNFPQDSYVYDYYPVQSYESNAIVLSSKQEIDDLFGATYSATWSIYHDIWLRNEHFTDVINKFDDEYFESNQVLTFFATAAGSTNYFKLKKINYQTGKLIVNLDHLSTVEDIALGSGTRVSYFSIIEIEKIEPTTQIEIKILGRDL